MIRRKPDLADVLGLLIALPIGFITTVALPPKVALPIELAQRGVELA